MNRIKVKLLVLTLLLISLSATAQVYTEKQTRHRFAQLNLGLDYQTSLGGTTSYLDTEGNLNLIDLTNLGRPRVIIGGTHFWGHADFYLAIPVANSTFSQANQRVDYSSGVETVFKYYPWRIEHKKVRPFVGVSIAPFYYEQSNDNLEFGNGPELNHTSLPLLTGLTFNTRNHLIEAGLTWNYVNSQEYYISRNQVATIETPPLYLNISYRYILETTIGAERSWESGKTQEITDKLAAENRLNGFFVGVGMSSAFWVGESSYNESTRPYLEKYSTSLMPDFGIGYYLHKPDVNLAVGYRSYGSSTSAYGAAQVARRRSFVLEATKFLFDYHGFVPFVGPAISYENLSFRESFERQSVHRLSETQFSYGLTFGWDIRPDRLQSWILRTNLRWFPNLKLAVEDQQSISFNNIEFNFIQLIIYPNRIF
ncbi:MAG: hypothetical protein ACFB15_07870 [Cyclobacteriaceae bacterium]